MRFVIARHVALFVVIVNSDVWECWRSPTILFVDPPTRIRLPPFAKPSPQLRADDSLFFGYQSIVQIVDVQSLALQLCVLSAVYGQIWVHKQVLRTKDCPSPPCRPVQLSIEEFLTNPTDPDDEDHQHLRNPLSAEFGIRTAVVMVRFITDSLPDFKLVSGRVVSARQPECACCLHTYAASHLPSSHPSLRGLQARCVYMDPFHAIFILL